MYIQANILASILVLFKAKISVFICDLFHKLQLFCLVLITVGLVGLLLLLPSLKPSGGGRTKPDSFTLVFDQIWEENLLAIDNCHYGS